MIPPLRDARAADAPALAALGARTFTETFGHLYAPADLAAFLRNHAVANWAAELADPAFRIRVADDGGTLAAYYKLGPHRLPVPARGPTAELRQFYLLTPWHGTGLADAMMADAIAAARAGGAADLVLSVFVDNHRARRFYERYGFERVGAYDFMVGSHRDRDDLMRLAL